MTKTICTCCGQTIKAAKTAAETLPIDTSALTDTQLFAYYKKTAALEDVRFMLRVATMSELLRGEFQQLEQRIVNGLARPVAYREYVILQDRWRGERTLRERMNSEPAIGSPEWREALMADSEEEAA